MNSNQFLRNKLSQGPEMSSNDYTFLLKPNANEYVAGDLFKYENTIARS